MKRKIIALLLIVVVAGTMLVGCSRRNAILLEDGKTLEIIDNTLGEGEKDNLRFVHTYTNSTVTKDNSYVYYLPVSESNPTERYFVSNQQGPTTSELIEITNVKNGDKIKKDKDEFLSFETLWKEGMKFVDETKKTDVHYSIMVVNVKCYYKVTRNNNITVWEDKILDITVISSKISSSPLSFTVEMKNFSRLPLLLSHKGDSWEIK